MPEYLAPGVYVEETSFRAKSIEGLSTTTTGFIGPTRFGPIDIEPDIVTSLSEFERTYGGKERLEFDAGGTVIDNYMWHAVRGFFEEGGKRLYISRTFQPSSNDQWSGYAVAQVSAASPPGGFQVRSRFPGTFGDARVTFTLKAGQNMLTVDRGVNALRSISNRDVVLLRNAAASPPKADSYRLVLWDGHNEDWVLSPTASLTDPTAVTPATLNPTGGDEVRIVTVTVTVQPLTPGAISFVASDLPLDPTHTRAGSPDSVFDVFAPHRSLAEPNPERVIANLGLARTTPIVIDDLAGPATGLDVLQELFAADAALPRSSPPSATLKASLGDMSSTADARSFTLPLGGGNDGTRPPASAYEGTADPDQPLKTGLHQFEDLDDISIVAAPGSTFGYENGYQTQAQTIISNLIEHAQSMRYRIAVIDCGDKQSLSLVRAMRARFDSSYGALYYPWIRILDPLSQNEINVPPSGCVAGIYARNDINRAVYKAPANEVVNLAIGFEQFLNKSQQDVLNPEGINCFRFFEGRGMRLWGARTISSDPEWKYVNLRRYFAYLEHSIDKGTQWAVFEPNGEQLWANVRRTVEDFLLNEWQNGALLGDKPEKAYFVKCDRSTMSQNDLDNGRLICLIGVAPLRPAEFVIFRIGQWTADRKV